jgi:hypothetical protein
MQREEIDELGANFRLFFKSGFERVGGTVVALAVPGGQDQDSFHPK